MAKLLLLLLSHRLSGYASVCVYACACASCLAVFRSSFLTLLRTQALTRVVREDGFRGYFRGNLANCIRVVPYSATQFVTFDYCKSAVASYTGKDQPTIVQRLACGACAGICASFATHPLDVIRTRLAVQAELKGISHTVTTLWGEGGIIAMYKGLGPTLASLAPFVAINFAAYDTLKAHFFPGGSMPQGPLYSLGMGASAGIIAQVAAVECASRPFACLFHALISPHAPPCCTPATCWRSLARQVG